MVFIIIIILLIYMVHTTPFLHAPMYISWKKRLDKIKKWICLTVSCGSKLLLQ